ncbi:TetR/AcrR family transcriptional regulator [Niallia sp. 03190]|uniref:TetR/AcrR family transcriptional regulator n=1 Tax=Niallia sp. 03190 TaxID=3458061 RepID=UPI004043F0C8
MEKKNTILSKKDILDAAEKTFRHYGPKKTSVTDIAKLLNVSHGTIYRHYSSKTVLREAVTERWLEEEIIAPLQALINSEAADSEELLKTYILHLISLKRNHALNDEEMFEMYTEVTAESAALIQHHVNCIIEQLIFVIEKGINANIIKEVKDKNKLARSIFFATARFHHPSHAYEWKSKTINEEFDQVWDLIKEGFKKV